MRSVYEDRRALAREIERSILQGNAECCSPIFGRVCKAIWPVKTAEQLAAAVGCSVRAAAYQISGESEPSARAVAVIVDLCVPRRIRSTNSAPDLRSPSAVGGKPDGLCEPRRSP